MWMNVSDLPFKTSQFVSLIMEFEVKNSFLRH